MKKFKLKAIITAVSLSGALIAGSTMAWFTDQTETTPTTFTAGTVEIQANRSATGTDTQLYFETMDYVVIDNIQPTPLYKANRVVENTDAGHAVILERITNPTPNPSDISDPDYYTNFYSMGRGGTLTIQLAKPMACENGIRVIECSTNGASAGNLEQAYVQVYHEEAGEWVQLPGVLKNTDDPSGHYHESSITIPESFDYDITKIKIIDASERLSSGSDGYDIFYLNVAVMNEGNWNPGDTNYIAYTVNNTGSKRVNLRVILSGKWQVFNEESGQWEDALDSDPFFDSSNVVISLTADNQGKWTGSDGTYYYNTALSGTYTGTPGSAKLYLSVHLKGEETGNPYQGKRYVLTPTFQAIQASHSSTEDGEEGWTWAEFDDYN